MAYGDKYEWGEVQTGESNYSDGTVMPHMEAEVLRNGISIGYVELHFHRTKLSPHVSLGLTSRLRSD